MDQITLDLSLPMTQSDVFHFDDSKPNFNDLAKENGFTYWFARDLMDMLGYQSWKSFNNAVQKAMTTCATLGIPIFDNFADIEREINGETVRDCRLSRFACYLTTMNGDSKKIEVARAQAYFAATAETFRRYAEEGEDFERLLERDEITIAEKTLSAAAQNAGVTQYGLFQNAGYRGMYNMNLKKLKMIKNVPEKRSPLDFMGATEMAANRFRITQTEQKLKIDNIKGQQAAENAAESVGRKVRKTMEEISGVAPEHLEISQDIKKIKSTIKASQKEFAKLDKK